MKTYKLDLRFETHEAEQAWIEAHCPDQTYNGEKIMIIYSSGAAGEDGVVLDEIWTVG